MMKLRTYEKEVNPGEELAVIFWETLTATIPKVREFDYSQENVGTEFLELVFFSEELAYGQRTALALTTDNMHANQTARGRYKQK